VPKRLEQLDIQGVYVQIFPEAFLVVALSGRHETIAEIDAQHLQPAGYGARSAAVHSQDHDDVFLLTVIHRKKWLAVSRPDQLSAGGEELQRLCFEKIPIRGLCCMLFFKK